MIVNVWIIINVVGIFATGVFVGVILRTALSGKEYAGKKNPKKSSGKEISAREETAALLDMAIAQKKQEHLALVEQNIWLKNEIVKKQELLK